MARNKSEKANMLISLSSPQAVSHTFEINEEWELLEGQLVNQALSQRLATEAEDQQAVAEGVLGFCREEIKK